MKPLLLTLLLLLFALSIAFAGQGGMPLLHVGQKVTLDLPDENTVKNDNAFGARTKEGLRLLMNSKTKAEETRLIAQYFVMIPAGTKGIVLQATRQSKDIDSPVCVKIITGKLTGMTLWCTRQCIDDVAH